VLKKGERQSPANSCEAELDQAQIVRCQAVDQGRCPVFPKASRLRIIRVNFEHEFLVLATYPTPPSFTYQQLNGREAGLSAFDTCLEAAEHDISMFDRDGQFYGLERRQAAELLSVFLLKNSAARIEIIVQDVSFLENKCPRLVGVLRRFYPRMTVRVTEPELQHFARGFAIFDHKAVLRRPHFDRSLSYWDTDEVAIGQAKELIEQIRQHSVGALQHSTGL
jgi:hypothetical protein